MRDAEYQRKVKDRQLEKAVQWVKDHKGEHPQTKLFDMASWRFHVEAADIQHAVMGRK